jgi:hypothetical protein
MALKMMNGLLPAFLKTVKFSIVGMNLVVMVWALHNTFHLGFNFSLGGLTVTPHIPLWLELFFLNLFFFTCIAFKARQM